MGRTIMKSYEVIDNLLPKEDFKRLQEILPKQVPFYFQKTNYMSH